MGLDLQSLQKVASPALEGVAIGAPLAGGFIEAGSARAQADAQASAFEHNALLARLEGSAESSRIRSAGKRQLGRARTQFAQGDVAFGGSALEFFAQQAAEIEREAVNASLAGQNTAALDLSRAAGARRAGKRSAASSLLLGGLQSAGVAGRLLGRV